MGLFGTVNVPDISGKLDAINGNLYGIEQNTKKMGYSLEYIEKDMQRVAESSEVIAGIMSREEAIALKRLREIDQYLSHCLEDEYNEEMHKERERIIKFLTECQNHRADFLSDKPELKEEK